MPNESEKSILSRLFEPLPNHDISGVYDIETQTWSHRESRVFSPVKLNKEM